MKVTKKRIIEKPYQIFACEIQYNKAIINACKIVIFSLLFHWLMLYEGREYSFFTGFYWTFTVMSTLGFGDITFTSDLGKIFSTVVLVSGIIFFLILLPFTFLQHFYIPWILSRDAVWQSADDNTAYAGLTSA